MILVISRSEDATADFLCEKPDNKELKYCRIDTDISLLDAQFHFSSDAHWLSILPNDKLSPNDISTIWFRRPSSVSVSGSYNDDYEKSHASLEWTTTLEGFLGLIKHRRWINHPLSIARSMPKTFQLFLAKKLGLNPPETKVSTNVDCLKRFWQKFEGNVVAKPISSGYIEREEGEDTSIYTNIVTEDHLKMLPNSTNVPSFFQEFIKYKQDVRITIVDNEYRAYILIDRQNSAPADIRRNNMSTIEYNRVSIPTDIESKLHRLMNLLELRFGAIDFVIDRVGNWRFLEVNPNGQWAWIDIVAEEDQHLLFCNAFKRDHNKKQ